MFLATVLAQEGIVVIIITPHEAYHMFLQKRKGSYNHSASTNLNLPYSSRKKEELGILESLLNP